MTPHQWLVILAQAAAIILLIIGYANEKKIVEWEQKQINRIKRAIRKRLNWWLETTETPESDGREVWGDR